MALTIIAHIRANEGKTELVHQELVKLIATTRKEAGCIQYDLHQDNEDPAHFFFYENWQTRELWQDHMQSSHIEDYLAATQGAVASFIVHELTQIEK